VLEHSSDPSMAVSGQKSALAHNGSRFTSSNPRSGGRPQRLWQFRRMRGLIYGYTCGASAVYNELRSGAVAGPRLCSRRHIQPRIHRLYV